MRVRTGLLLGAAAAVVAAGVAVGALVAARGGDSDTASPTARSSAQAPTGGATTRSADDVARQGPAWPVDKAMRLIDRTRIGVEGRVLRVDSETTLCSGLGAAVARRGTRSWRAFDCTFTTFSKRGVDRDLDFRLRVTGARRFVVFNAHWVGTTR